MENETNNDGDVEKKPEPRLETEVKNEIKNDVKAEVISWVKVIAAAVLFAVLISNFVIVNAQIPSGSMESTIMTNDRVIAFRQYYLFAEPERFDIVVFPAPDEPETLFVKRIIGLPGETIDIVDGKVYVDGAETPIDDEFTIGDDRSNFGPYTVSPGSYFVMGDNRERSKDSRYWTNTYVPGDTILGKVIFRYYRGFKIY
jgi:signal peptidase I